MLFRKLFPLAVLVFVALLVHAAENGAPTFTSAEEAGADYVLQGEYQGSIGDASQWGAHVIATGKGTFKAIGYRGGLPGDGWTGEAGQYLNGKLEGGVVTMQAENFTIIVDGKVLKVINAAGDEVGVLKKMERKSETLDKKPPEGAIVLFDGSSLEHWNDAKIVEQELLGATNCYTKQKFDDHMLHIEFKTPFMPESSGQGRGNSGVYIQSRYELQVLDSFGLEGKDNECGGIYNVSKPKLNMCYPPLTWQTYDIDFTSAKYDSQGNKTANARVTVRHNGVVIHDDLELPRHTPGRAKEGPGSEALFLQNHSNPVAYRNIWVVAK